MINLKRYHKQSWPTKMLKEYKNINKLYDLDISLKKDINVLKLQVFKEGLKNKRTFEDYFEKFRNEHYDMWNNMTFNERNFLITQDIATTKNSLTYFENDKGERIYIPFFNELLNTLYHKETAILELPQFLSLYDDFNDEILDISRYDIKPYVANMSNAKCITYRSDQTILYDFDIKTFFKIDNSKCESYPIYIKSEVTKKDIEDLAQLLVDNDFENFLLYMYEANLMSPRLKRKYKRILKRRSQ